MPHASCPSCCGRPNGLRDLGRSLCDQPAPLDCHQALGRRASHLMTPLRAQLSMFGVETPRAATPTAASALAVHGGASPIFQHRSGGFHATEAIGAGFAWRSSLGERGGQSGSLPLYVPSDTLICDARPPDSSEPRSAKHSEETRPNNKGPRRSGNGPQLGLPRSRDLGVPSGSARAPRTGVRSGTGHPSGGRSPSTFYTNFGNEHRYRSFRSHSRGISRRTFRCLAGTPPHKPVRAPGRWQEYSYISRIRDLTLPLTPITISLNYKPR